MNDTTLQDQIDDATFDFTMGDNELAIKKLTAIIGKHPESFAAWLALTEIYYAQSDYNAALDAAERAIAIKPDDIHINTSLSRIWVERGDKDKAEHYGAQARMLGWKEELKTPAGEDEI